MSDDRVIDGAIVDTRDGGDATSDGVTDAAIDGGSGLSLLDPVTIAGPLTIPATAKGFL